MSESTLKPAYHMYPLFVRASYPSLHRMVFERTDGWSDYYGTVWDWESDTVFGTYTADNGGLVGVSRSFIATAGTSNCDWSRMPPVIPPPGRQPANRLELRIDDRYVAALTGQGSCAVGKAALVFGDGNSQRRLPDESRFPAAWLDADRLLYLQGDALMMAGLASGASVRLAPRVTDFAVDEAHRRVYFVIRDRGADDGLYVLQL